DHSCTTPTVIRFRIRSGSCTQKPYDASGACRRWWSGMITSPTLPCCVPRRITPEGFARVSRMPTLEQTQQLLWKLITAPEGAAAGLAALAVADRATAKSLVCGDERIGAIERVEIYADMYFYRLRD